MSVRDFARQMKAEIQGLKDGGAASINVENLINYLDRVEQSPEPEPSPASLERYKAELGQHLEMFRSQSANNLEMFKSVIQAGQNAIRSMILINGGASVAVLAFLGHMARIDPSAVQTFAAIIIPFASGTLLGGFVSGVTYLSQWLYGAEKPWSAKAGMTANIVAIVLGFAAFVAFGIGAWWTYDAFANIPVRPVAPAVGTLGE